MIVHIKREDKQIHINFNLSISQQYYLKIRTNVGSKASDPENGNASIRFAGSYIVYFITNRIVHFDVKQLMKDSFGSLISDELLGFGSFSIGETASGSKTVQICSSSKPIGSVSFSYVYEDFSTLPSTYYH